MPRKFDVTAEVLAELKGCLSLNEVSGELIWIVNPRGKRQKGDRAGSQQNNGYRIITFQGRHYYEHRLIWFWLYGDIPAEKVIDHINGNKGDSRPLNLRLVSQRLNSQNVVRNSTRKNLAGEILPQGVHMSAGSGKYYACIKVNYRKKHLGTFDSSEEAHIAYLRAKSLSHPASTIERLL
ncbi:HNH endonuclease [Pantoea sp. Bo_2]|uniref:HNH endonuclease n=1 Tax=Candidatus Pantoea gossypiicola TaxID=2608008 RepID=A0AB34CCJ6_9GAMM|nr:MULTISPECIES: HNH endonuclease [Pantoea]KAA5920932.1 HNH endonuclease [Pantoea sp. VH_8]KAA5927656.1 HNH endonuclease [Pantoea sp. VH_4]KAA5935938.1 HNH endonuclease [Pantoea sp. VH_3]KAA5944899.1 HNH endonuclease [Pantoea sp. VH_25]KAA5949407.1 HNH endonuclease [Pantoea sp. VH_24]